ncbi:MAG: potassium transporter TrkH [Alphaproteobacteria bacterium CG11_big_fil_rev_8_21_14_0_20_39_49]|nr:MAG: potassium transporter TrkH [Alphaproteobacteria bacterium CG11_big_fil_rev_8_21_14_0_20_39_49]
MHNFRPVLYAIGILLTTLAVFMLIPAVFDYMSQDQEWVGFFLSSFITFFVGLSLTLTNKGKSAPLNIRQAFVLTTFSWLALVSFAALPFKFSAAGLSVADAFFESMSGLTTTGASVMTGLDDMPPGILLWRSLLHWIGGIGIIVVALAVLPMLNIGGMQLFRTESSDKTEKILPRTAQISIAIGSVYLLLTVICYIMLIWAGMSHFDAINHAMSTVSTGGFSTHDQSIGYFNSIHIEYIVIFFMLAGGIPFVLYIHLLQGNVSALHKDSQVRWFLTIVALSALACAIWLTLNNGMDLTYALRVSLFNLVSIATTTGFASTDYSIWGGFPVTLIFMLSVVGGCTGSTTGGIKVFRYQVLYQTAKAQINHLIQPHAVIRPRFNGKPLSEAITSSVMSYIILFAFSFLVVALILSLCGLDYISSMSGAAATLANVGPGLGDVIGPAGNYADVPVLAKWVLSFAMLLGRLEIFTILVLFSSYFWQD